MGNILVTGALGQIGSELVPALRAEYGRDRVIATDLKVLPPTGAEALAPYDHLDCTDPHQLHEAVRRHDVSTIYHLAALLSASAEAAPQFAWTVNMSSLYNVLEVARGYGCQVFFPSSIGAFGPDTPRDMTPQVTVQRPTTIYGVTKVSGELLCDYYASRFGVDTRGLRLPGLVSYAAAPGGGTTDYAVEMFCHAVRYGQYTCFLAPDTRLDMAYMPDAVDGMMRLMATDAGKLRYRNAYNITAMSVTPEEIAAAIRAHMPGFEIDYEIDPVRQAIADSWPRSLDDSAARADWGWSPKFDLHAMARDMLLRLGEKMKPARQRVEARR
ncbi:L-threonine 3-dehydrogenase [Hyphomicrobium sulfonivorans]|uniref:L-threonine 3-dehydrogenase n=1 Tax=Hyphomicrobium sulfonivorans TaxID=121290 RepID=A0A120CX40_HYPSL|nr:NAD-dependent epimerase/dehydratase family protein [Hyphomicrobium sulfonivorans]KWT70347.1 L-threonine 3-dehydrogenase [Hyphomicrobium sulfonivorans]